MSKSLLEEAAAYCEAHSHRLTQPRRDVLRIIARSPAPLGAYEILKTLSETIQNPKPPTVYRAIEFWQQHGFIHRIESLNAYVACCADHLHKGGQFLVCESCGHATEMHLCAMPAELDNAASRHSFSVSSWKLEIHGLCRQCS